MSRRSLEPRTPDGHEDGQGVATTSSSNPIESKQESVDDPSVDGEYYPTTAQDQFAAYFYLSNAFPAFVPQVVANILELAEYWVKDTTTIVSHLLVTEYTTDDTVYLRSDPIIGHLHHPVRRVIFSIKSHDQGWSDDQDWHNTYQHSWTWFQAGNESGFNSANEPNREARGSVTFGPNIFCNVHASSETRRHVVCWPSPTDHRQKDFHWFHNRDETEVENWVDGLRCGDRVTVMPRARFSGWYNSVYEAEIVVFSSFLWRPMS